MISDSPQEWRDLVWALNSPSLLGEGGCSLAAGDARESCHIDPDDVATFIGQEPTRRVGRYFERLVYFYLSRVRRADIIASGLQIQDGTRTVGELDFVFRDDTSMDLVHWETAVKFYLWCPERSVEGSHLIGPNAADTFERKITRLLQHQVPLGQTKQATEQLRKTRESLASPAEPVGIERPQSQAFVRGRIFYPAEFHKSHGDVAECAHPSQLSPGHLRGVWIKESELGQLVELPGEWFALVEKPYWLAPPERFDLSAAMVIDRLKTHFQRSRSPQLLACSLRPMLPDEVETQHVFVMPEEWPGPTSE